MFMPCENSHRAIVLYLTNSEPLLDAMWCKLTWNWCMVWDMHHMWKWEVDTLCNLPSLAVER